MENNVEKILKEYLDEHGFDGLYFPGECGCQISELMPCDQTGLGCRPGYRSPDKSGEFDFIIGPHKHFEPGDRVTYIPDHYKDNEQGWEHGMVKSARPDGKGYFVVYNCGGNWADYKNYTAASTNSRDLRPGWKGGKK